MDAGSRDATLDRTTAAGRPATPNPTPVALVTGGSRGIGRAVVEALLGKGYRVFFCARTQEAVEATVAELKPRFGAAISGRTVDVRHQDEVDAFVTRVTFSAGRLDVLVNNAGLGIFGAVDELTGDQFREVIETNLCGPFYFLRAAAPVMRRQGNGLIVNIASLAGRNAFAGGAAYNASKFGLVGLSEASLLDLRTAGIKVTTILPGSVDTGFAHRGDPNADRSWMLQPQDIAAMVIHLLTYPDNAMPSLIEMRPTRPGGR